MNTKEVLESIPELEEIAMMLDRMGESTEAHMVRQVSKMVCTEATGRASPSLELQQSVAKLDAILGGAIPNDIYLWIFPEKEKKV